MAVHKFIAILFIILVECRNAKLETVEIKLGNRNIIIPLNGPVQVKRIKSEELAGLKINIPNLVELVAKVQGRPPPPAPAPPPPRLPLPPDRYQPDSEYEPSRHLQGPNQLYPERQIPKQINTHFPIHYPEQPPEGLHPHSPSYPKQEHSEQVLPQRPLPYHELVHSEHHPEKSNEAENQRYPSLHTPNHSELTRNKANIRDSFPKDVYTTKPHMVKKTFTGINPGKDISTTHLPTSHKADRHSKSQNEAKASNHIRDSIVPHETDHKPNISSWLHDHEITDRKLNTSTGEHEHEITERKPNISTWLHDQEITDKKLDTSTGEHEHEITERKPNISTWLHDHEITERKPNISTWLHDHEITDKKLDTSTGEHEHEITERKPNISTWLHDHEVLEYVDTKPPDLKYTTSSTKTDTSTYLTGSAVVHATESSNEMEAATLHSTSKVKKNKVTSYPKSTLNLEIVTAQAKLIHEEKMESSDFTPTLKEKTQTAASEEKTKVNEMNSYPIALFKKHPTIASYPILILKDNEPNTKTTPYVKHGILGPTTMMGLKQTTSTDPQEIYSHIATEAPLLIATKSKDVSSPYATTQPSFSQSTTRAEILYVPLSEPVTITNIQDMNTSSETSEPAPITIMESQVKNITTNITPISFSEHDTTINTLEDYTPVATDTTNMPALNIGTESPVEEDTKITNTEDIHSSSETITPAPTTTKESQVQKITTNVSPISFSEHDTTVYTLEKYTPVAPDTTNMPALYIGTESPVEEDAKITHTQDIHSSSETITPAPTTTKESQVNKITTNGTPISFSEHDTTINTLEEYTPVEPDTTNMPALNIGTESPVEEDTKITITQDISSSSETITPAPTTTKESQVNKITTNVTPISFSEHETTINTLEEYTPVAPDTTNMPVLNIETESLVEEDAKIRHTQDIHSSSETITPAPTTTKESQVNKITTNVTPISFSEHDITIYTLEEYTPAAPDTTNIPALNIGTESPAEEDAKLTNTRDIHSSSETITPAPTTTKESQVQKITTNVSPISFSEHDTTVYTLEKYTPVAPDTTNMPALYIGTESPVEEDAKITHTQDIHSSSETITPAPTTIKESQVNKITTNVTPISFSEHDTAINTLEEYTPVASDTTNMPAVNIGTESSVEEDAKITNTQDISSSSEIITPAPTTTKESQVNKITTNGTPISFSEHDTTINTLEEYTPVEPDTTNMPALNIGTESPVEEDTKITNTQDISSSSETITPAPTTTKESQVNKITTNVTPISFSEHDTTINTLEEYTPVAPDTTNMPVLNIETESLVEEDAKIRHTQDIHSSSETITPAPTTTKESQVNKITTNVTPISFSEHDTTINTLEEYTPEAPDTTNMPVLNIGAESPVEEDAKITNTQDINSSSETITPAPTTTKESQVNKKTTNVTPISFSEHDTEVNILEIDTHAPDTINTPELNLPSDSYMEDSTTVIPSSFFVDETSAITPRIYSPKILSSQYFLNAIQVINDDPIRNITTESIVRHIQMTTDASVLNVTLDSHVKNSVTDVPTMSYLENNKPEDTDTEGIRNNSYIQEPIIDNKTTPFLNDDTTTNQGNILLKTTETQDLHSTTDVQLIYFPERDITTESQEMRTSSETDELGPIRTMDFKVTDLTRNITSTTFSGHSAIVHNQEIYSPTELGAKNESTTISSFFKNGTTAPTPLVQNITTESPVEDSSFSYHEIYTDVSTDVPALNIKRDVTVMYPLENTTTEKNEKIYTEMSIDLTTQSVSTKPSFTDLTMDNPTKSSPVHDTRNKRRRIIAPTNLESYMLDSTAYVPSAYFLEEDTIAMTQKTSTHIPVDDLVINTATEPYAQDFTTQDSGTFYSDHTTSTNIDEDTSLDDIDIFFSKYDTTTKYQDIPAQMKTNKLAINTGMKLRAQDIITDTPINLSSENDMQVNLQEMYAGASTKTSSSNILTKSVMQDTTTIPQDINSPIAEEALVLMTTTESTIIYPTFNPELDIISDKNKINNYASTNAPSLAKITKLYTKQTDFPPIFYPENCNSHNIQKIFTDSPMNVKKRLNGFKDSNVEDFVANRPPPSFEDTTITNIEEKYAQYPHMTEEIEGATSASIALSAKQIKEESPPIQFTTVKSLSSSPSLQNQTSKTDAVATKRPPCKHARKRTRGNRGRRRRRRRRRTTRAPHVPPPAARPDPTS